MILLFAKDKRPPIVKVVSAGTSSSMRHRDDPRHRSEGESGAVTEEDEGEDEDEENKRGEKRKRERGRGMKERDIER